MTITKETSHRIVSYRRRRCRCSKSASTRRTEREKDATTKKTQHAKSKYRVPPPPPPETTWFLSFLTSPLGTGLSSGARKTCTVARCLYLSSTLDSTESLNLRLCSSSRLPRRLRPPRGFVSKNGREETFWVLPGERVRVRVAQRRVGYFHPHFALLRRGDDDFGEFERGVRSDCYCGGAGNLFSTRRGRRL